MSHIDESEVIDMIKVGYLRGISDGRGEKILLIDETNSFNVARAIMIAQSRVNAAKRDLRDACDALHDLKHSCEGD